jgi:hypothetical protein
VDLIYDCRFTILDVFDELISAKIMSEELNDLLYVIFTCHEAFKNAYNHGLEVGSSW